MSNQSCPSTCSNRYEGLKHRHDLCPQGIHNGGGGGDKETTSDE